MAFSVRSWDRKPNFALKFYVLTEHEVVGSGLKERLRASSHDAGELERALVARFLFSRTTQS
jgi:hypothetical protein